MEIDKNGLLYTYLESIKTPELFSSYKIKKFPSLNEYAENYLANLDKLKLKDDINNYSNDNINDNNSSFKGLSNDFSNNETNIQTNQISKINDKFLINKYEEINDNEKQYSDKLKMRNNLAIEHLKRNFYKKTNNSNTISKINSNLNFTQNSNKDNLTINSLQNIKFPLTRNFKKDLSELYNKISPSERTRLNSPLFSAFRSNNSKNSYKSKPLLYYNNYNVEFSNLSKSRSFLSDKCNTINNHKYHKLGKKIFTSSCVKNFLTNYIYSDRGKFRKGYKNGIKKNKNRIQLYFSESRTDESSIPFNSFSNRYNTNKSCSQSIKDYWKEREIKKQIKMEKIRKEKIYKDICEIKDKPEIDKNSRKIAEKLGCNNTNLSVFDRLSEFARNQFIFNERKFNIKTENNNYKIRLFKEKNYENFMERNKKGLESNENFKSFKQIENINKNFLNKINNENKYKKTNNYKTQKEYLKNRVMKKDDNLMIYLSKNNNQCNNANNLNNEKELENLSLEKNININANNKIIKPKIMYKKIQLKKNNRKNSEKNYITTNKLHKHKSIYINKPDNLNNSKNRTVTSNYNSKKNLIYHNSIIEKSKNDKIFSYKTQTKNKMINKFPNYKHFQNINELFILTNKNQKTNKLNINSMNCKNNINTEVNCNYKFENINKNINKHNTINILNIKKLKNKSNSPFNKNNSNQSCLNNNKKQVNKLLIKNSNKSYLVKLESNDNQTVMVENKNRSLIDTLKNIRIPLKNEINNKSYEINKFISNTLNKKDYIKNYKNTNCDNKNNNLLKNEYNNRNRIKGKKNGDKINNIYANTINNNSNMNEERLNNTYENNINNNSNINIDQLNNIKKRRLELLKLLDFSSSIGTNVNNNS